MPVGQYAQVVTFSNVTSAWPIYARWPNIAWPAGLFNSPTPARTDNQSTQSERQRIFGAIQSRFHWGGPAFFIGLTTLVFAGTGQVTVIASRAGDANWVAGAERNQCFRRVQRSVARRWRLVRVESADLQYHQYSEGYG